jgi:maltose alpha-D-glucosyltransferase/alpha-amylase
MWFKNAIIYSLDVETFMDGNADGIGDFRGLHRHVDYFETLGVTCIWLQPFQPTPNRDDGYDIIDYYAVDPRLGTFGDFASFVQELDERGIRLIIDLVVNHTSDQHPWFKAACAHPASPYRDYYVWSRARPENADKGMVFPGAQKTTWTWNEQAKAYYYHRFFAHQPDLNIANPQVREEILRVMGFWLRLGVAGFRVDAAPFLIELTDPEAPQSGAMYAFLEQMRDFLSWRRGDAILLAEANVAPGKLADYFGNGRRMHMLFNFLANQALFLALARKQAPPLRRVLDMLPDPPEQAQWAQFLRGHDELDLGRLSEEERQEVFATFGPLPDMQIFGRGIRRRLAPMMNNDRRRIEMAHSLMFSLPGCQVIRYGDEIGMGDDLSLEGRKAVRTPMQWSDGSNAGFSSAAPDSLIRPMIACGDYGYCKVNLQAQVRDPDSLLNRIERLIRMRRSTPEIGLGTLRLIEVEQPSIMAHSYDWRGRRIIAIHNLAEDPCDVQLDLNDGGEARLLDLTGDRLYPPPGARIEIAPYGYRWFRFARTP